MSMKSELDAYFTKAVKKTGVDVTQDPLDQHLHDYAVYQQGESFFKKMRDKAKKEIEGLISQRTQSKIDAVKDEVSEKEVGNSILVGDTGNFTFEMQFKKPVSALDANALRVELLKVMPEVKVDAILLKATVKRAPACTWKIEKA